MTQPVFDIQKELGDPIQIGMIVRDFTKLQKGFCDLLGIQSFRMAEFPPDGSRPMRQYRGKEGTFCGRFYFFQWNNIEFEVIEPTAGESIWEEFLAGRDAGLHHIKFAVDRLEPVEEYLSQQGVCCAQKGAAVGPNTGKTWAYYDTRAAIGFDIELINKNT